MPADRFNSNNGRPLMPTLATTRTAKTPLTPRLAATATNPTQPSLARRPEQNNPSVTPRTATFREDSTTPNRALLGHNVTPRSASRKTRAGSTHSTPNGTPVGTPASSRPVSSIDIVGGREYGATSPGLGITGTGSDGMNQRPRSVLLGPNGANRPQPPLRMGGVGAESEHADVSSKFFHASDAQPRGPEPPAKKAPVFFYANGTEDNIPQKSPGIPSPPLSQVGVSKSHSKFFHADAISDTRSQSPALTPPITTTSPEPILPSLQRQPTIGPPSPNRENGQPLPRKGVQQGTRPNIIRPAGGTPALPVHHGQSHLTQSPHIQQNIQERRRSSAETAMTRKGHSKSVSLSSIEAFSPSPKQVQNSLDTSAVRISSPLQNENRMSPSSSDGEHLDVPASPSAIIESMAEAMGINLSLSAPQSPSASQPGLNAVQELAANARRERKVLDLEISNSSLLAINRQLEREVRKQKAELRRFRRLSRAGKFAPPSAIEPLDPILDGDEEMTAESDINEISDAEKDAIDKDEITAEMSDDDLTESEGEGDSSSASLSSLDQASRDASHLVRDSKRLEIDLSKHRELLVDSMKMNQSLKRCLGWTEELIKEGRKALEYQVRVSDIQLGGRVLAAEDNIIEEESTVDEEEPLLSAGGALLSPWTPPSGGTAFDFPILPDASKILDTDINACLDNESGRDSGVELSSPEDVRQKTAISLQT